MSLNAVLFVDPSATMAAYQRRAFTKRVACMLIARHPGREQPPPVALHGLRDAGLSPRALDAIGPDALSLAARVLRRRARGGRAS